MSFSIGLGFDGSFNATFLTVKSKAPVIDRNWEYNFDNVNDYISYPERCFDPDNPDFELDFIANLETSNGTIISQNLSNLGSEREFQLYKIDSGLKVYMGGKLRTIVSDNTLFNGGIARYNIIYTNGEVVTKKNGVEIGRAAATTVGTAREPTAITFVGARASTTIGQDSFFGGVIRDLKFYKNGDASTGTLCIDSPIYDGPDSTEIENLVGQNGVNHNFENANWQRITPVAGIAFKPATIKPSGTKPSTTDTWTDSGTWNDSSTY